MRNIAMAVAAAALLAASAHADVGSVAFENGEIVFRRSLEPSAAAWANFTDADLHPSHFGQLTVRSSGKAAPKDQFFGAGYVEGRLTARRMAEHTENWLAWTRGNFKDGKIPDAFETWFKAQDEWSRAEAKKNETDFWWGVQLMTWQYDGLVEGYRAAAKEDSSLPDYTDFELYGVLQSIGDLLTLLPALDPGQRADWEHWPAERTMEWAREHAHCSGLAKVTGDFSELFAAHVAWFSFASMNRIAKTYEFAMDEYDLPGRRMSMSSYPGLLSSLDDFYTMPSSGLAMIQTSNNIFNTTLYSLITTETALAWQRIRVANLLAHGGREWTDLAAVHQATYANQYFVIDFGRFSPGSALKEDTLWVTEQIPGLVVSADMTDTLARGYWPSYNVPYFKEIYDVSGYKSVVDHHRELAAAAGEPLPDVLAGLDYQMAPRAQIFRRDQGNVKDMTSFQYLMRYNDFQHDPYSKGSPWNAICSRGDLALPPSPDGCYDGKSTSDKHFADDSFFVLNGPTTNDGQLPPFSWTANFNGTSHVGQPHTFDFQWEKVRPDLHFDQ